MKLGPGVSYDPIAFDREFVAKHGLWGFVQRAWKHLESAPFVESWAVREWCKHLQAASNGEIRHLLGNMPPGMTKSTTTSICWPAWEWTKNPGLRWIFASYDGTMTAKNARAVYELVRSKWYQDRWPHVQIIDQGVTDFRTSAGGFLLATSMRAKLTGRHAHRIVVDDPHNAIKAQGSAALTGGELAFAEFWFRGALTTRFVSGYKTPVTCVVMQRFHLKDLSGVCLALGGFVHFWLPMHCDPKRYCRTRWGGDRRTHAGELLCPELFDEATVAERAQKLGEFAPGQLEQAPTNLAGTIVKKTWLKYYGPGTDRPTPNSYEQSVISCDFTFTGTAASDNVCIQLWSKSGPDYYLREQVLAKLDFPQSSAALRSMIEAHPEAHARLIEHAASGPAILQSLGRTVSGLIAVKVTRNKPDRLRFVSPLHEAGNVWYPNTVEGRAHGENMIAFPFAEHDDDVDAETQALAYFAEKFNPWFGALDRLLADKAA